MDKLLKKSWISIVLWVVLLAGIMFTMPDLGLLVREKGQVEINSKYSSSIAQDIIKEMDDVSDNDSTIDIIMIYHNEDKISQGNLDKIKEKVNYIENNKEKYGVRKVLNVFTEKELEDQVISKDGTTILVPVKLQRQERTVDEVRNEVLNLLQINDMECYTTGSDLIIEDLIKTVEGGVKTTELITIALIVAILVIIFKSPVTPLVTLATVGISYLASKGIVLQLVDKMNFTISNFTNVFLILVLFGIGTDYTMLILMRFKEELNSGVDKNTAIINTYKTAGKTVIISSLTIFIGFACLVLSQFKIYNSASAVAIGVAVLILAIFTLLPVAMKILGKNIFFSPFKSSAHADNKLWKKISTLATRFPYIALAFVLAVTSLIYLYTGNVSFNNMNEVGKEYSSVKGFNIVAESFSIGKALPITVAIENNESMDKQSTLAELDEITEAIKAVDGVSEVYSVTQPKGEKIKELYINDQTASLNKGLKSATEGTDKIKDGMKEALDKLNGQEIDTKAIESLQKGSHDLSSNMELINESIGKLNSGMKDGAEASKDLASGIENVDNSLGQIETAITDLKNSYAALGQGYKEIEAGYGQLRENIIGFKVAFEGVISMQNQLEANHPELATDKVFVTMKQTSLLLNSKLQDIIDGITKLNMALNSANSSLEKANQGLTQVEAGIAVIKSGTAQLKEGSLTMSLLLNQAADGENQIADAMNKLTEGSKKITAGQDQLINGVGNLSGELNQLTSGLSGAKDGLSQISNGLNDASIYVEKLSGSKSGETFYIPQEAINSDDFSKSMDMYMSKNREVSTLSIILNVDPYSDEAMDIVREINNVVSAKIEDSSLNNSRWGISGISQMNVDLKTMSDSDFKISSTIMLIGIIIVLIIVTKDFGMSIFIMISLITSYYISIGTAGFIFKNILGKGELSWSVPFFSFTMIIALGVDYSIFLVMRYMENNDLPENEAIIKAAKNVGGVIFSAAIILSGTFAAVYPSGVLTLMQLSVTVIIGIMLLTLVFIPIFIPAMISLKFKITNRFGRNNEIRII